MMSDQSTSENPLNEQNPPLIVQPSTDLTEVKDSSLTDCQPSTAEGFSHQNSDSTIEGIDQANALPSRNTPGVAPANHIPSDPNTDVKQTNSRMGGARPKTKHTKHTLNEPDTVTDISGLVQNPDEQEKRDVGANESVELMSPEAPQPIHGNAAPSESGHTPNDPQSPPSDSGPLSRRSIHEMAGEPKEEHTTEDREAIARDRPQEEVPDNQIKQADEPRIPAENKDGHKRRLWQYFVVLPALVVVLALALFIYCMHTNSPGTDSNSCSNIPLQWIKSTVDPFIQDHNKIGPAETIENERHSDWSERENPRAFMGKQLQEVKVCKKDAVAYEKEFMQTVQYENWIGQANFVFFEMVEKENLNKVIEGLYVAQGWGSDLEARVKLSELSEGNYETKFLEIKMDRSTENRLNYGMFAMCKRPGEDYLSIAYVEYGVTFEFSEQERQITIKPERSHLFGFWKYDAIMETRMEKPRIKGPMVDRLTNLFRYKALKAFQQEGLIDGPINDENEIVDVPKSIA